MDYQVSNKAKLWTTILVIVGIVITLIGVMTAMGDGHVVRRFLSNLLSNSFFFFTIAISALFFLAVQHVAEVGWFVYIKRPIEAITGYIPVGIAFLVVTFLCLSFLKGAHIYLWMDPSIMQEGGENYDYAAAKRGKYMNIAFFWIRAILYFAVYYFMWKGFIKRSLMQDQLPENALEIHQKNFNRSALFLLLFAFFSSMSSWDWLMSIDIHWHSTLFGWYVFAGGWVSAMVMIVVLILYLKKLGYLPKLNESHIHDVGTWIFALSFLWAYLWFSQFMLIWYANMPEEAAYYITRIENYKVLYFGMFIVNFVFPMLILMSRDAKRHLGALVFVGFIIIIGHWLDVWIMVMGGAMGPLASIGFLEVGMALFFFGLFIRVVLVKLSKAPLISKNNPYMDESLHHEI